MGNEALFDVGLVLHTSKNYGNNLTNYSLIRSIISLSKSIVVIPNKKFVNLFGTDVFKDMDIYYGPPHLLNYKCRMFLLGSDQTFATWCIGTDYFTCMPWVDSSKYKASFGSSFGSNDIEYDDVTFTTFRLYLSRFNRISLRERSSVDMLSKKFGLKADFVLDPVFLTSAEDYRAIEDRSFLSNKKFVGAYILDLDEKKTDIIKAVMSKNGIEDVCVVTDAAHDTKSISSDLKLLHNPSVEQFLAVIDCCDVFVTDSFHGACFAIMFNKQFYITGIKSARGLDRIRSLCDYFDINDRWVSDLSALQDSLLDYDKINNLVVRGSKQARQYLSNVIEEGTHYFPRADEYSFEYVQLLKKSISEQSLLVSQLRYALSSIVGVELLRLYQQSNIVDYLSSVPLDSVCLFSVCDCSNINWSLVKNHFDVDLLPNEAFVCIKYDGQCNLEKHSLTANLSCDINDVQVIVKSVVGKSKQKRGSSSFIIGGREYCVKKPGLNVMVCNRNMKIVDLINAPIHKKGVKSYTRINFLEMY